MKIVKKDNSKLIENMISEFKQERKNSLKGNNLTLNEPKFDENYLKENFDGKYTNDNNNVVVQCKGRRELRQLIERCKQNNIKYKFDKLINENYKYNFKFTLNDNQPKNEELVINESIFDKGKKVDTIKEDYYDSDLRFTREGEQDNNYIIIEGTRDGYGIDQVENNTITVGELINYLSEFDEDTKVIIGNDWQRGYYYTYGYINEDTIKSVEIVDSKEESLKESQSQEIRQAYDKLSKINNVDFNDLVYGKGNFMDTFYPYSPENKYVYFPDFDGDVIYNKKHFDELKDWAKKEKGLDIKGIGEDNSFETNVLKWDENLEQSNDKEQLQEELKILGSLDEYTPSDNASDLWNKIVDQQLIRQLNRLLEDLYPDGVSLKQLDDLLSLHKDFIEEALGMRDEIGFEQQEDTLGAPEEPVVEPQENVENQEVKNQEVAEVELDNNEPKPTNPNAQKYMSNSTGYGGDDYEEDDSESFLM